MADLANSTPPGANGTPHLLSRAFMSALMGLGHVITAHQDCAETGLGTSMRAERYQRLLQAWARFDGLLHDTLRMTPRSAEDHAALRMARLFAASLPFGSRKQQDAAHVLRLARATFDVSASARVARITGIAFQMLEEMLELSPLAPDAALRAMRIRQDRFVLHA